jgi:nitroreductase
LILRNTQEYVGAGTLGRSMRSGRDTRRHLHSRFTVFPITGTPVVNDDAIANVFDAIAGRRSIRRFLPTAVPRAMVEKIIEVSARAPSGTNSQPWFVDAVAGDERDRLVTLARAQAESGQLSEEYHYSPNPMPEPYMTRRRQIGYALYAACGIERSDYAARKAAALRNYEFFGAPVGLIVSMDRALTYGSWLDVGMFMQNIMVAARGFGLETCPQQAWADVAASVRSVLGIPLERVVIAGIALGYADRDARENTLITEREPLASFATFSGFPA